MKEIATIKFEDADSSSEAVVVVRQGADYIGLALSILDERDIEVFMRDSDTKRLSDALTKALEQMT